MKTPPDTPTRRAAATEVFGHRPFLAYEICRTAATIGYQIQSVAVGWQVYDITHSTLDLGFVGLTLFLPAMFFSLIGGDIADRFNRRKVLMLSMSLQAFSAIVLAILSLRGISEAWMVYPSLIILGLTRSLGAPAGAALMSHLVPTHLLPRAIAWHSSFWQIATILGPTLGGALYAHGGASNVYWTSTALALASIFAAASIGVNPPIPEKKGSSAERLKAGLRFVWRQKSIFGTISLDLFAVLLGGAVALLPVYAKDILQIGPTGLGIMRGAPALGATVMAIYLAYFPIKRRAGITMFLAVGLFGVATCVFGISRSFSLSLVALFVMGAADMVSVVIRQTLVQLLTPEEMRGRVSSVNQLFIGASNELGEFESGLTAHWFGTVPAVIMGGLGTCAIVGLWLYLFPSLRKLDSLDLRPE